MIRFKRASGPSHVLLLKRKIWPGWTHYLHSRETLHKWDGSASLHDGESAAQDASDLKTIELMVDKMWLYQQEYGPKP